MVRLIIKRIENIVCFSRKIRKFAARRLHIGTASEWSSRE